MPARSRVLVALVAVIAITACKRELKYDRVELPGMSIEMPKSKQRGHLMTTASSQRYASGQVMYGGPRPFLHVAGVSWRPGVRMTTEELETAASGMATLLSKKGETLHVVEQAREVRLGDRVALRSTLASHKLRLVVVDAECGARSVTLFAMAEDPEPLVARMSRTFACTPDAAEDAKLASDRSPLSREGFDGWRRIADDEVFIITDGTIALSAQHNASLSAIDELGIEKALSTMMPPSVGTWSSERVEEVNRYGHTRRMAHGWLNHPDGRSWMIATAWTCGPGAAVFAYVGIDEEMLDARSLAEGVDALARARCLTPGEEPPTFPPYEPPADDATAPTP